MQHPPVTEREFAVLMAACPGATGARRLGVGVSGGPDSMALCLLADRWARPRGVTLDALTVDHGLRREARAEATQVGRWLAGRGIAHRILVARGARPVTGIQRTARERRLELFDRWARETGTDRILLAHSADDQVETVLQRMMADSGPDGLAGIGTENRVGGTALSRPLLAVARGRLAATCRAFGQPWISDPSNRDPRFARVRLRSLAPELARSGAGPEQVLAIARSMAAARAVMDDHCSRLILDHGAVSPAGFVRLDAGAFLGLEPRFAELLLARLLRAVGGMPWPPRRARIASLAAALRSGVKARTLGGCMIRLGDGLEISREPGPCAGPVVLEPGLRTRWDNRFEVRLDSDQPARLETLDARGWAALERQMRDQAPRPDPWTWPQTARLAYPVVRHLDGTASLPHFVRDVGACRTRSGGRAVIRFCPDQDWIRNLAMPTHGT